ncbi:enoyl-CoA hydratase-related protein [Crenobacter cavernae]|uniref:Enoyl-CoA hydratase/isomerase family protein n=1 Tax=Crenobacter cavernae TaxID=2290923 RepID=A0A345Y7G9_9NEIS|nr:enoyl-CoA hydratase-related protein [Crenobacter cavernae]AXK39871.1 enoyl-CoA hydratase/isomerase family protein [Crenobacter cavernae]
MDEVRLSVDARGVATVTLNRPELHNALDDGSADLLIATFETLAEDPTVRVVVLTGSGISFSAGHDHEGMRRLVDSDEAELVHHARLLSRLLATLDTLPKPTVARVQGSAFGLGAALVACCDVAIATSEALFSFADVRLGVIPAISAPYVMRAIGERAARRYFVTGERFNAGKAKRLGLIHQDVEHEELDATIHYLVEQLLLNSPQAMREVKILVRDLAPLPVGEQSTALAIERIARVCASAEGREGIRAFLEQRKPGWVAD